ncbi:glycosyltransferase family 4 protein [Pseudobutyrivibrio xylanivorans]|uniref:Glycosyltransferase involved in cell wall bisynthesis n=1 Tax=Pseudobutyrivibrio xylanivorans DSM 14809 TaxID=1123012 RepID=A0A1M6GXI7_PSEXY|nr:glycosyltransferase family 4 protein [Pseudobutyrivibrio xylanivorans]SHJ14565.1 Glycosyltransferase involved in cell wall bisynthesis [Pseudobutyrivibrio xylanivorans DSM 14809]
MSTNKKALMHAHTAYMVTQFNIDNIKILQDLGYTVDVACCWKDEDSALSPEAMKERRKKLDDLGCRVIEQASMRKIFNIGELRKAYLELKKEVEANQYQIVHTQSPIGGVICRLACRRARMMYGTKVVYAAHGFHFFKGAPLKNWLVYYNVEKYCSKFTDLLITINKEDYDNARKFNAKQVAYIPGAGVDTHKFVASEDGRARVRKELGIDDDTIVLLSVGELIHRKNHGEVLRALKIMKDNGTLLTPDSDERVQPKYKIKYLIAGRGKIQKELEESIKHLGLQDYVQLLGFRRDVADVFAASDIYVFPSHQEGLPVALMEAMSVGMPVVCSKIRGNIDLIQDGEGGYLFDAKDAKTLVAALNKALVDNEDKRHEMGQINVETMKEFDKEKVNEIMRGIYDSLTHI